MFSVWIALWAFSAFGAGAKDVDYRIGVGDVLEVRVFGETEFSGAFKVGSEGTIDYPFLRKIQVKGKTTEELAKELTSRLKDGYLSDPQVAADMKEYRSRTVLVLGAVVRPGTYVLKQDTRILPLISEAGGITPNGGKRILLLRGGDSAAPAKELPSPGTVAPAPVVIDYYRLVHEGDFSQNLLLQDGDVVNVPKANEIFVLGNVARPGPVAYEEKMTILQAVTLAGGPTGIASPRSTYILRTGTNGEEKIAVRLDKILDNKSKDVVLKANDVIVIPESFF